MIIIKTSEEIAKLKIGGPILARVLRDVAAAVRPGITTKELDAIAYSLDTYPAKAVILKSADSNEISEWFRQFYHKFEAVSDDKEEPMMNLLAWKTDDLYYLVIYPRKAHRPKQFFAEGEDNLLISPASIDFGGAFITPLEKDFRKITSNDIADILQQVTISEETFNALIHE